MSNDEDHMEMANRPLTMNDSDDEETEIFHQEHRKFVANDIFQKSNQNTPMTSSQVQVYSDNPVSELKLPDLNADTSSEDEDLLDLINNKDVLNESVINNSKSGKTVKLDNVFSL